MTSAETTFPTATAANTACSPKPSQRVAPMAATSTPITRTVIQTSGTIARPRPWNANASTMLTATKG